VLKPKEDEFAFETIGKMKKRKGRTRKTRMLEKRLEQTVGRPCGKKREKARKEKRTKKIRGHPQDPTHETPLERPKKTGVNQRTKNQLGAGAVIKIWGRRKTTAETLLPVLFCPIRGRNGHKKREVQQSPQGSSYGTVVR